MLKLPFISDVKEVFSRYQKKNAFSESRQYMMDSYDLHGRESNQCNPVIKVFQDFPISSVFPEMEQKMMERPLSAEKRKEERTDSHPH